MKLIKVTLLSLLFVVLCSLVLYFYKYRNQETLILDNETRLNTIGKYVKLVDGWTHYNFKNNGNKSMVILIHGGGIAGIHVWQQTVEKLSAEGFDILSYDLFGRGYSDRPNLVYNPKLLLKQFEELLDSLHIERQFHLVSLSLGAMVAVDYANTHANNVQSLIFIDPILQGNYRPNKLLKIPLLAEFIMTVYWYPRAVENQRKEFVNMKLFDDYAIQLKYFMNFKGYKQVNYSTWMNTLQENYIPALELLGKNKTPKFLIYGQNDPYFPKESLPVYFKALPNLNVLEVARTGHMPHYEKPREVNQAIVDFLNDK